MKVNIYQSHGSYGSGYMGYIWVSVSVEVSPRLDELIAKRKKMDEAPGTQRRPVESGWGSKGDRISGFLCTLIISHL